MKTIDREAMLKFQGDRVLVIMDQQEFIFTIVHFVDGDRHQLELVNRADPTSEPIPLTQAALDNLEPVRHGVAKWKLVL